MDYIATTIDDVSTKKQITMYPNQKPWMNKDVCLLLKAAFRSGDAQAQKNIPIQFTISTTDHMLLPTKIDPLCKLKCKILQRWLRIFYLNHIHQHLTSFTDKKLCYK